MISLIPVFCAEGYTLQRSLSYSWKLFPSTDSDPVENSNYSHRYPFTDIFIMTRRSSVCHIRDKAGRNAWPNESYPLEDVLSPLHRHYGDLALACHHNPHNYLDRNYPGWRETGATHFFNHKSAGCLQSCRFELEQEVLQPARPFK